MYRILRTLLFLLPPEKAHHFTMRLFRIFMGLPWTERLYRFQTGPYVVDGLTFRNRVGLAAGFDKDGKYIAQLNALNFGFIEVGTVTPKPQSGNPQPRMFRLSADHALINRMGFNNDGVKALKKRMESYRRKHPKCDMQIGINMGKNKLTPNEDAVSDYLHCYRELYNLGDFFVINVSSPNTPGLRELQNKSALSKIIGKLLAFRREQSVQKPLYLKIAPDMPEIHLLEIIELQQDLGFEGIIATNTSTDRSMLKHSNFRKVNDIGDGGLSGRPILELSNSIVQQIRERAEMTIIGVGGIEDAEGGKSKFAAGADLIEIYTGFIYTGPGLIKKLALMADQLPRRS